jgi:hypothetical protein
MIRILLYASFEIILGAAILYFDLKAFLLYFLIIYFINSHLRTESLVKAIQSHNLFSTIHACAIRQKLGITNKELEESISEVKTKTNKKNWDKLMKDIGETTGVKVFDNL